MSKSVFNDNISILSAMLAPSMRHIFTSNIKALQSFIPRDTLDQFIEIEKVMPPSVNPEGLREILELKGLTDFDAESIIKSYELAYNENTQVIIYNEARESLYQAYLNSLKGGALTVLDAIKENKLYFPEYGAINNEYSKTVVFTDIKISNIDQMMGRSFKSSMPFINEHTINRMGYFEDQLICIAAPPGVGKSLFCMNEVVSFLMQGYRVYYLALGDLNDLAITSRACTITLNRDSDYVYSNLPKNLQDLVSAYPEFNNLAVDYTAPGTCTVDEWIDKIKHTGAIDMYDVFIVDYDSNFKTATDNIYEKGDEIYTALVALAKTYHKLVIAVSQPKVGDWKQGLTLGSLSESSRKQQHIDMLIGISPDVEVRNRSNYIGTIDILKNRWASQGRCYYVREPSGRFSEVSKSLFDIAKDSRDRVYFNDFDGCKSSEYVKLAAPNIMDDIQTTPNNGIDVSAELELLGNV